MVESIQGNQHLKIIYKSYGFTKGSLIPALVPLPTKGTKSPPYSRTFEFAALYSKQLIQIFCSGERFGTFVCNGTKVKIPSEIKLLVADCSGLFLRPHTKMLQHFKNWILVLTQHCL